ncbi:MAG: hypothetical protein IPP28_15960 [Xanthomonadales bacterium]|nr:hypothetical protein [Xanthomonadales bacterium]
MEHVVAADHRPEVAVDAERQAVDAAAGGQAGCREVGAAVGADIERLVAHAAVDQADEHAQRVGRIERDRRDRAVRRQSGPDLEEVEAAIRALEQHRSAAAAAGARAEQQHAGDAGLVGECGGMDVARQALGQDGPGRPRIVAAIDPRPGIEGVERGRLLRIEHQRQAVNRVGDDAMVGGRPGAAAVDGAKHAAVGGRVGLGRVGRVEHDLVHAPAERSGRRPLGITAEGRRRQAQSCKNTPETRKPHRSIPSDDGVMLAPCRRRVVNSGPGPDRTHRRSAADNNRETAGDGAFRRPHGSRRQGRFRGLHVHFVLDGVCV